MKKSTRDKILDAGLKLWPNVTPTTVSKATGISQPNVFYHFPEGLADAVAAHAVKVGDSHVIVQLMASGHAAVENLSPSDRIRHFNAI